MGDVERQVERVIESYKAAVFAADTEAFMRLYHPGVRVFDTWGVWVYEGAPSWRRAAEDWFASLGGERVRVAFSDVQIAGASALATLTAIVTYAGESAQGEVLRSMQNRLTWVLRESGHVLRIVHEHTSAPVAFDGGKAILTRAAAG